jgi:hypothetical protein
MTLIEKFDAVLKALYDISGKRPTFGRIMALLRVRRKNIHWGEVWDILNKMIRDNLLHPGVIVPTSERPNEVLYLITFEGKLMCERNGLKGKIRRENFTKTWVSVISILTLIIAGLSFYFSLSSVSDSTVNKINETLKNELIQQDSMQIFEKKKLKILQAISDSVSKKVIFNKTHR